MSDRPNVKPGDWIYVGSIKAIVAVVRTNPGDPFGDCEVVFNPVKPTNCDVRWSDDKWKFVEAGDYCGYADKYDRLRPYVAMLKGPIDLRRKGRRS